MSQAIILPQYPGDFSLTGHTHSQYLTSHQSLSSYATKTYVTNQLAALDVASSSHTHNYASTNHTHSYASTSHTHSDYASSSHSHSNYATKTYVDNAVAGVDTGTVPSHTHSNYASSTHTHSSYASSNHSHSGYASSSHTHNYASTSHTHSASDITGLGTSGGSSSWEAHPIPGQSGWYYPPVPAGDSSTHKNITVKTYYDGEHQNTYAWNDGGKFWTDGSGYSSVPHIASGGSMTTAARVICAWKWS